MSEHPTIEEARRVLRDAVDAAVLAPSSHNTQPWRFRIVESRLEIRADPERQIPVIDRERRQLLQSCGCAVFNARVAIRARGFAARLTVLPNARDPDLVAAIDLGPRIVSSESDLALVHAIPLRHTNRRRFLARPVSADNAALLADSAELHGAWFERLLPDRKRDLAHLIDECDRIQYADPAFRHELASWLVPSASRRLDGIPFVEKEYGSRWPLTVARTLRSPDLGERFGALEEELVLGAPLVVVMGTAGDDVTDWLACGQALEAVLLHATHLGLSAAFDNQVLEVPDLRGRVAAIVGHPYPQMVLRIGYPEDGVHHAAPRRPVREVLEIDWLELRAGG